MDILCVNIKSLLIFRYDGGYGFDFFTFRD